MGQLKWTEAQKTPPRWTPYVHWWLERDGGR